MESGGSVLTRFALKAAATVSGLSWCSEWRSHRIRRSLNAHNRVQATPASAAMDYWEYAGRTVDCDRVGGVFLVHMLTLCSKDCLNSAYMPAKQAALDRSV